MDETQLIFGDEGYLLDVYNHEINDFHKAYLGSYFGNVIETYSDNFDLIYNFTIVSLDKATIGTPDIKKAEEVEEVSCVRIPEMGDAFQFDFELFLDDNSITIVNREKEDTPVNMISEDSRVEYGLNDYEIVYMKIKDLTKEEHDKFLKVLKDHEVEIETQSTKEERIQEIEEEIEEKEDISIIQTTTIGSRGWGYDNKDSDIDVRFVFVRDPNDYISINKKEETITYPIENGEDIVGYDLGKFLRMICSQNPMAYEIIYSPKQEKENENTKRIREFADEVLDPNKMVRTYQHLVEEEIKKIQEKKDKTTKLSIYIVRMLGMIHYLQKNGKFPPCSIEKLFNDPSNIHLKELIEKLIEYKQESNTINLNPEIIELMKKDLEVTKGRTIETKEQDKEKIERKANELFRDIVMKTKQSNKEEEMKKVTEIEKTKEEENYNTK